MKTWLTQNIEHSLGLRRIACFALLLSLLPLSLRAEPLPSSIIFYYAPVDSVRELVNYDRVVVSANQISDQQIEELHTAGSKVYAYLSVGEWDNSRGPVPENVQSLIQNRDWNSSVINLQNIAWKQNLYAEAQAFYQRGFDGLFLDTLDSYQLADLDANQKQQQRQGLLEILDGIYDEGAIYDGALILNRGFELSPDLTFKPEAIVAESRVYGYDASSGNYFRRDTADTQWVDARLNEVKAQGIEPIVIDYLPTHSQEQRAHAAREIIDSGFTPYISNGLLTDIGTSTVYTVARRVLVFFDSSVYLKKQSKCHRFLASIIEYKGYVPECFDVNEIESLNFDPAKYAGVVFWIPQESYANQQLVSLIDEIIAADSARMLFIGELPESGSLLSFMQLRSEGRLQGALQGKGIPLNYGLASADLSLFSRYELVSNSVDREVLLEIEDARGNNSVGIMRAPWGGVVTEPVSVQELMGDRIRWSVDPLEHILPLLKLPEIPVADVTTESGRRILTVHIDGDGFPSVTWTAGRVFAGESVLNNVLKRFPLPHTVSIIEAEIAPHGLFPQYSAQLEEIARDIFMLDHVEVASHTFSHPFFWDDRVSFREKLYGDSLNVPDYEIDFDREIKGSIAYIERELIAPGSGKEVVMFLWSGMANPTAEIIEKTRAQGTLNVNGGNTYVVDGNFSLAQVYPHLNWYPNAVQVYAPLMNENLYTELWQDNFHGFSRAIESFRLLGEPRRLKPISIYYHMYSGVYPSSLEALYDVYNWAQNQEITPLFLSEYARRAKQLYETGIARPVSDVEEGQVWYVNSTGVKSLRLSFSQSLHRETYGVAGISQGPDGAYATLTEARVKLIMSADSESSPFSGKPFLSSANGVVDKWQWQTNGVETQLVTHVPLSLEIAQAENCELESQSKPIVIQRIGSNLVVSSQQIGRFDLNLRCQD